MKIAVLGAAGGIGQPLGLLLKTKLPAGSELSLYDIAPLTPGVAVDLSHIPTAVKVTGYSGEDPLPALKNADIVLISAGVARKPGMARAVCIRDSAIAACVLKEKGVHDPARLFGVTTLDIIRSSTFVSEAKGLNPEDVNVPVIGGHSGITILPLLSQSGSEFSTEETASLTERIQNAGTEVVEAKAGGGSATLSMSYAGARFCLSLVRALNGEENVVECTYIEGSSDKARFFAQPVLLGKSGVEKVLNYGDLTAFEESKLNDAIDTLKSDISSGELFKE